MEVLDEGKRVVDRMGREASREQEGRWRGYRRSLGNLWHFLSRLAASATETWALAEPVVLRAFGRVTKLALARIAVPCFPDFVLFPE